ncbi:hypothetical protein AeRB84_017030 [Aphanomyces euteiches]|nr:hypothetical protein AeRB84_017030 [Aphanomyces euteiches]
MDRVEASMCKQTNPQATTARINRLKLKVKQLRATRDELKAIADRLVELHEDLIMEKAKMEKAKDEARSRYTFSLLMQSNRHSVNFKLN